MKMNLPKVSDIFESGVRSVESIEGRLRGGNSTCCSAIGDNILGRAVEMLLVSEYSGWTGWCTDSTLGRRRSSPRSFENKELFNGGSLTEDRPAGPLIVLPKELLLGELWPDGNQEIWDGPCEWFRSIDIVEGFLPSPSPLFPSSKPLCFPLSGNVSVAPEPDCQAREKELNIVKGGEDLLWNDVNVVVRELWEFK